MHAHIYGNGKNLSFNYSFNVYFKKRIIICQKGFFTTYILCSLFLFVLVCLRPINEYTKYAFTVLTYMITDTITNTNTNAPPIDNPNIKGQSTSSSLVLVAAGTVNISPLGRPDGISPAIASCISLAGIVEFVSGLITAKLTALFSASMCTRTLSLVKVLIRKEF